MNRHSYFYLSVFFTPRLVKEVGGVHGNGRPAQGGLVAAEVLLGASRAVKDAGCFGEGEFLGVRSQAQKLFDAV